ncbi:MAG: hypothetical protein IK080_01250 [Clostridia bacterium]|nr:hypothetical protein [Clostridia bacterium]
MPIIREAHHERYTIIANTALEDPRLTNAAKGLLVRMLSFPDNWEFCVRGLAAVCHDGRDAVARQLAELERLGYLQRKLVHSTQNRFADLVYYVYESPADSPRPGIPDTEIPDTEIPDTETPDTENPDPESPAPESPDPEIPSQTNTIQTNTFQTNTNETITIRNNSSSPPVPGRTAEEIEEKLDFEILSYEYDPALLDTVLELMLEAESGGAALRVNGSDLPAEKVRARFRQLDDEHIRFVLDELRDNGARVHHLRAWLRTALYNAPAAMEAWVASAMRPAASANPAPVIPSGFGIP